MAQRHTTLERQKLYEEVWSIPMTKIAESYNLSGNEIKRAAYAMGIPLPSSGHWAKVAHGKAGPRPELHDGDYPATYKHSVWFNEDGEEVEQRLAALLPTLPELKAPPPAAAKTIKDCDPLIQRMAARLKDTDGDTRGWPRVSNAGCLEIAVHPQNQLRALLAMDYAIRLCKAVGMTLRSNEARQPPAHFEIEGIDLTLRVFESGKQNERELTAKEKKEIKDNPNRISWIPNRYFFKPSNVLRLEVLRVGHNGPEFSIQDSADAPLLTRLSGLPERMRETALRARLWKDVRREEEERAYERGRLLRERQDAAKAELEKLAAYERMADKYERAARLRRFADVLDKTGYLDPSKAHVSLNWLRNAAEWLDPTVRKHWPAVDDVEGAPRYE